MTRQASKVVPVSDDAIGLGEEIDLNDAQWDFRALGCDVSELRTWASGEAQYIRIMTQGGLIIDLSEDRTVNIDSEQDGIWPDSHEWPVLRLVMRLVGAPAAA